MESSNILDSKAIKLIPNMMNFLNTGYINIKRRI
jgi:hypothetical protein